MAVGYVLYYIWYDWISYYVEIEEKEAVIS